jgi:hypothetical protein
MRRECHRLLIRRSFDEDAVLELRPGSHQRDEVGGLTARQRCCADSMSLNAIAIRAFEPDSNL